MLNTVHRNHKAIWEPARVAAERLFTLLKAARLGLLKDFVDDDVTVTFDDADSAVCDVDNRILLANQPRYAKSDTVRRGAGGRPRWK